MFISEIRLFLLFPHGFLPLLVPKLHGFRHSAIVASSPHPRPRIAILKVPQRSQQLQGDFPAFPALKAWRYWNLCCVWPLRFEMHAGPSATPASRVTKIHLISPFGAENKKQDCYFMVESQWKIEKIGCTRKRSRVFLWRQVGKDNTGGESSWSSSKCCLESWTLFLAHLHDYMTVSSIWLASPSASSTFEVLSQERLDFCALNNLYRADTLVPRPCVQIFSGHLPMALRTLSGQLRRPETWFRPNWSIWRTQSLSLLIHLPKKIHLEFHLKSKKNIVDPVRPLGWNHGTGAWP